MSNLNADQITEVYSFDFTENPFYTYKPKKTFLGFTTQKEGVYFFFTRNLKPETEESLKKSHNVVINKVVYTKPHVVIKLSDGKKKEVFFDTYEEALAYEKYISSKINVIQL